MKYFLFFLISLLLAFSCKEKSSESQNVLPTKYPLYEDCDSNLLNQERIDCIGEKLGLFYHYYLTNEYSDAIRNTEDSIMLWLEIDTSGQMHPYKITHTATEKNKALDSIFFLITNQTPIFVPAEDEKGKIPFRFKLPIILTK